MNLTTTLSLNQASLTPEALAGCGHLADRDDRIWMAGHCLRSTNSDLLQDALLTDSDPLVRAEAIKHADVTEHDLETILDTDSNASVVAAVAVRHTTTQMFARLVSDPRAKVRTALLGNISEEATQQHPELLADLMTWAMSANLPEQAHTQLFWLLIQMDKPVRDTMDPAGVWDWVHQSMRFHDSGAKLLVKQWDWEALWVQALRHSPRQYTRALELVLLDQPPDQLPPSVLQAAAGLEDIGPLTAVHLGRGAVEIGTRLAGLSSNHYLTGEEHEHILAAVLGSEGIHTGMLQPYLDGLAQQTFGDGTPNPDWGALRYLSRAFERNPALISAVLDQLQARGIDDEKLLPLLQALQWPSVPDEAVQALALQLVETGHIAGATALQHSAWWDNNPQQIPMALLRAASDRSAAAAWVWLWNRCAELGADNAAWAAVSNWTSTYTGSAEEMLHVLQDTGLLPAIKQEQGTPAPVTVVVPAPPAAGARPAARASAQTRGR